MAAYAALVSVMNTMDQVQIHPRISTCFDKKRLESLGDTVCFLLDFIESYSGGGRSRELEDLEGQITCAAHAAEDVIESHIVDLILAQSTSKHLEGEIASVAHAAEDATESQVVDQLLIGSTNKKEKGWFLQKIMRRIRKKPMKLHLPCLICNPQKSEDMDSIKENDTNAEKSMKLHLPSAICDLQKATVDMDSIKENVRKVENQRRFKDQTPHAAASSWPVSGSAGNTTMVGFDDYLIPLMDRLTGLPSHQLVIPIIGMGGIGKTTLARNVYENLLIKQHFDVCAWATISQNYSVRDILLQLLSSQEGSKKFVALDEHQLGIKLHKSLFSRRYLVVLDDMWSIEAWNEIKFFFPDNNNGGRIVVTSRLHEISLHFNSPSLAINFLDKDTSLKLFCQESFGEEGCPAELEEVGKKICENCKGLPLSIAVIGGFLRKSSKEQEYWEGVARDTYSVLNSEGGNQCMNILSLSYNHLPAHLKPCLLYTGVFAEDAEIRVSRLINLWVAEGFLRPKDGKSLEEVGEGYLKDLVDRNLILVKRWGSDGKIMACSIHDLLRELCLIIGEKENFLCVLKLLEPPPDVNRVHRIVINETIYGWNALRGFSNVSPARSLTCKGRVRLDDFKLLRVLRAIDRVLDKIFIDANLSRVNLRCLDLEYGCPTQSFYLPEKISLLWNLQTLRIKGFHERITAPSELWEMVQLRHLQVDNFSLPDPPRNGRVDVVLPNLQTLCKPLNLRLSEEVCKRIPNVKKFQLVYSELLQGCDAASYYCSQNLGRFRKLESLKLVFEYLNWRPMVLNMTFPSSLKKLTLLGGGLHWDDLDKIGSLPNLEVLKLRAFAVSRDKWNPVEGEFLRLKFLEIRCCSELAKWNADYYHFPVLEKLVLVLLYDLDEIPSGIGEISTLRSIRLSCCSIPCVLSAVKILEEQESVGNEDLQVEARFYNDKDHDRCIELMEEDGFTSKNLHIKRVYEIIVGGKFCYNFFLAKKVAEVLRSLRGENTTRNKRVLGTTTFKLKLNFTSTIRKTR